MIERIRLHPLASVAPYNRDNIDVMYGWYALYVWRWVKGDKSWCLEFTYPVTYTSEPTRQALVKVDANASRVTLLVGTEKYREIVPGAATLVQAGEATGDTVRIILDLILAGEVSEAHRCIILGILRNLNRAGL